MTTWVVTEAAPQAELGPTGSAEVSFTVTNRGPVADEAVFEAVPGEGAAKTWFTVARPQQPVGPGQSLTFLVTATVPAGSAAGSYWLQGRVYSADTAPEESSALSNRVAFEVRATPPKPKPWWLLAVAGLVVVVLAVGAFLLLRPTDDSVTVPDLTTGKKTLAQAKKDLKALGLATGGVRYRQQPSEAGRVVRQSVIPNTSVAAGTKVDLIVGVALAAPTLEVPAAGATIALGDAIPPLSWRKVEHAASYQVDVRKETCSNLFVVKSMKTTCSFTAMEPGTTDEISFTSPVSFDGNDGTIDDKVIFRLFYETGRVQWRVTAYDVFGNPGPPSEFSTFQKTLN
ncbi:MAG: PASTA domain-containing protein [Actinopolymorphaceae bacterium]